jgi:SAM-dependent methyltransferase
LANALDCDDSGLTLRPGDDEKAHAGRVPERPASSGRPRSGWASYDGVAETYARVSAPRYFQAPARHLVGLLAPRSGERFLDVGCGTGAVAAEAASLMGGNHGVAGIDRSPGMLTQARPAASSLVAAVLPLLPWKDASFDLAAAGFVLNHLPDVRAALTEIRRVLRPGGRLGVTSWARSPSENEAGEVWARAAADFVDPEELRAAMAEQLPGEAPFARPEGLARALSAAGLSVDVAETVPFTVILPTGDYVDSRLLGLGSRFMESVLPPWEWRRFVQAARDALWESFGSELLIETRVAFAVGAT